MSTFVTQLKREFWENRGGFLRTPFIVVSVFVLITLMGLVVGQAHLKHDFQIMQMPMAKVLNGVPAEKIPMIQESFATACASMSMVLQFALGIVLFFYLLGALFDERKDRSVLFWKSMPVSDLQTVLAKIVAATLLAPLIAWVAGIAFNLLMLGLAAAFLELNGVAAGKFLWFPGALLGNWVTGLAAIPVNALWALPSIGWLLLVSSWARGKPFLWAVFVPLIAGLLLTWFDALSSMSIPDTWYWKEVFARGLLSIFPWSFDTAGGFRFGLEFSAHSRPGDLVRIGSLLTVLGSLKTWLGAAAGVAMISAAVYFRRYRELSD